MSFFRTIAFSGLLLGPATAFSAENCGLPAPAAGLQAAKNLGDSLYVDRCGRRYEAGYRLEGNTLFFPGGGKHEIAAAEGENAEDLFRETYGLMGPRDALTRTRW
ncbi:MULTISPECIES: hypothetical protein [unclassified Pannonibacter]|uniref:hypothetical protein n=1 Tax=unclassified Pannonibacter TaxID=2627228 RepID=UPI001646A247|nr:MULTISPECIES: hypothetical protein [unclassified Pannonibacter]